MNFLKDLRDLFIPYRCIHCQKIITKQLLSLCLNCSLEIEFNNTLLYPNNVIEKIFWGRTPIVNAASLVNYYKKTAIQSVIQALKYQHQKELGHYFANCIIAKLENTSRFKNIDLVIPVPLHPKKEKQRGYNQIEDFGKTLATYLKVPFYKDVLFKKDNQNSQTIKNREARFKNIQNSFGINLMYNLENKHILIVDDIVTTGATLISCANTLHSIPNLNISIITIAYAV